MRHLPACRPYGHYLPVLQWRPAETDNSLVCCSEMWGAFRWTARFLLLVMLAPAYSPLAMACAARPGAMHCMRHPESVHSPQPAMPCHHSMAEPKAPQSESSKVGFSEASFQANDDNCCQNHCCCCATTSEWARPASKLLGFSSLLIETASPSQSAVLQSIDISGHDSARAPPRS